MKVELRNLHLKKNWILNTDFKMNPYLDNLNKISELENKLEVYSDLISTLEIKISLNKDAIQLIKNTCTHRNSEGLSTWLYTGQDTRSGRSEHSCTICDKRD